MATKRYPSDLTDAEWAVLEPLLAPGRAVGQRGRPRTVPLREIVNGILYVLRTGCQWRALPKDLPNWQTVYWYHRKWLDDGVWEGLTDALRRQVRVRAGRDADPSAAILDSQSVKTTERGASAVTTPARR